MASGSVPRGLAWRGHLGQGQRPRPHVGAALRATPVAATLGGTLTSEGRLRRRPNDGRCGSGWRPCARNLRPRGMVHRPDGSWSSLQQEAAQAKAAVADLKYESRFIFFRHLVLNCRGVFRSAWLQTIIWRRPRRRRGARLQLPSSGSLRALHPRLLAALGQDRPCPAAERFRQSGHALWAAPGA